MPDESARGPILLRDLRHAAFPRAPQPGALVYLPHGLPHLLDTAHLSLVVYLHGFDNCIENVVRPEASRCPGTSGLCPAADLLGQMDRSGRQAVLLLPELAYHA